MYGPDGQLLDNVHTEPAVNLDAPHQRIGQPPTWQVTSKVCTHDTLQSSFDIGQRRMTEAMSVVVDVCLISGKTVSVEVKLDETVATLKRRAQTALAVGKGQLLDASGGLLDDDQSVKVAKLETGTSLTLGGSRFKPLRKLLPLSWAMDRLSPGAKSSSVETVMLCKIS